MILIYLGGEVNCDAGSRNIVTVDHMFGIPNQEVLVIDGCSMIGNSYGSIPSEYKSIGMYWRHKGLLFMASIHPATTWAVNNGFAGDFGDAGNIMQDICFRLNNDSSKCNQSSGSSSLYGDFLLEDDRDQTYYLCQKNDQFRFSRDCSNFHVEKDPYNQFAGATKVFRVEETKDNISFTMESGWTIDSVTPPGDCPNENSGLNALPGISTFGSPVATADPTGGGSPAASAASTGGCQYRFTNGTDNYTFLLRHIDNKTLVDATPGSNIEPNPFLLIEEFQDSHTPPAGGGTEVILMGQPTMETNYALMVV